MKKAIFFDVVYKVQGTVLHGVQGTLALVWGTGYCCEWCIGYISFLDTTTSCPKKEITGGGTRLPGRLGYPHTNIIPAGVPTYPYGRGTSLPVRLGYPHTNIKPAGVPAYPYGWGTRIQILYRHPHTTSYVR
ncbi:hypothetical protein C8F04DRAFT_1194650 [Mycena alexandri]|uniref:Uncharacterized protein n=1 Tax=Mycena alexandri TaxID=1745969 RepID=A0AAD6S9M0_9AGAR|nr:hypothetical protein C8F04DRAFT_1194650 [Mycena alexandri]